MRLIWYFSLSQADREVSCLWAWKKHCCNSCLFSFVLKVPKLDSDSGGQTVDDFFLFVRLDDKLAGAGTGGDCPICITFLKPIRDKGGWHFLDWPGHQDFIN